MEDSKLEEVEDIVKNESMKERNSGLGRAYIPSTDSVTRHKTIQENPEESNQRNNQNYYSLSPKHFALIKSKKHIEES